MLRQRNELSSHVLLGADALKEISSIANLWINTLKPNMQHSEKMTSHPGLIKCPNEKRAMQVKQAETEQS